MRIGTEADVIRIELPVPDWKWWSPQDPNLYELEIGLTSGNAAADGITVRAAFRTIEAKGRRLLLNGKLLSVRGLLN
jgi:beta-galactosidase/beta-glucuronidase